MALSDILSGINSIVNTGTAAAQRISQSVSQGSVKYNICSYPDGTVLQWPVVSGPCPQRSPNTSYTTSEIIGIVAIFGAVGVLLIFILMERK